MTPSPTERLTASKLSLAATCPGSFSLPHDVVDPGSPASRTGTAVHRFVARLLTTGECDPRQIADEAARRLCARLDLLDLFAAATGQRTDLPCGPLDPPVELMVETAFAYDPTTTAARVLKTRHHRDYSDAPQGWICGTADAVALTAPTAVAKDGARVVITDWKTGRADLGDPAQDLQLRFLALAASRALGLRRAAVQFVHLRDDGSLLSHPALLEPEDLARTADELAEISAATGSATGSDRPDFVPGSHCARCPAIARCPAVAGAAQALLTERADDLSPADAARAWSNLRAVEAAAKKTRETLARYVAGRGGRLDLPGGAALNLVQSTRETIVGRLAAPLLRERYGDAADVAFGVTKTGLKKVAGEEASDVIADIDARGGLKRTTTEYLREDGR